MYESKPRSRYKTIPLKIETYLHLKQEKLRLEENFGRKLSWDELIEMLIEFKDMIINDK
ncbi:hypothetical protein [Thermococcus barophilus]|uniref:hypothetical protein n=1 Tax=Thermococcus barophilus TaxID=55802 RepID=UPI00130DEC89|nr:hypothetical protein [Thermococcus barophilus]